MFSVVPYSIFTICLVVKSPKSRKYYLRLFSKLSILILLIRIVSLLGVFELLIYSLSHHKGTYTTVPFLSRRRQPVVKFPSTEIFVKKILLTVSQLGCFSYLQCSMISNDFVHIHFYLSLRYLSIIHPDFRGYLNL